MADQNATYFLSFIVVNWIDLFTGKEDCLTVIDSLNEYIKGNRERFTCTI
ncbi:MAG: hypothetical protein K2X39_02740 [Silvanigrellaceae bacterium]|jgi:hypothetical protein|nr:hypothetical protein [Silvanigrellaceae bacterium]